MPVLSRLLLLTLAVALSGCFQISSLLTVRPDGSATLRDEVTLSGFALIALQDAAEMGDEETEAMFDASLFEDRAAALGEGVRVVSTEISDDGYVAVYSVPDVSALRFSTPSIPSDGDDEADGEGGPGMDEIEMSFAFNPGDPSTLRIVVPKPDAAKPGEETEEEGSEEEMEEAVQMIGMMRSFFDDARMTVRVAVEGEIVDTTAEAGAVEGSTVTVFDVPFAAIFDVMEDNPELISGAADDEAMMDRLAETEGVTFQRPGTVRVRFR